MDISTRDNFTQDELNLAGHIQTVWAARVLVAIMTAVVVIGSAIAFTLIPKKYQAMILISPVTESSGSNSLAAGLGSVASSIGGLASLAGLSVGGDSKKNEYVAVLQSEALTESFIQKNNLLPVLYPRKWDREARRWKVTNPEDVPTLWKANRYFAKSIRDVSTNSKTGLVTLTITWTDPTVAASWANDIVKMTNEFLRDTAISESERNIAYLNSVAAKTNVVEERQTVFSILQSEITKRMLATGREDYAFKILDPAVPAEKQFTPVLLDCLLGGLFVGLCLSVATALLRGRKATAAED